MRQALDLTIPTVFTVFLVLLPVKIEASLPDTRVALHVTSPPVKATLCTTTRPDVPCSSYSTEADLGLTRVVYLVTARSPDGIIGLSCGVDYDPVPFQGVHVFQWVSCTGAPQYPNEGPNGLWPAAGGGNRITWASCPGTSYPPDGVHTVFGAFYIVAYSPDTFAITANNNAAPDPEFEVLGCGETEETPLDPAVAAGRVVFSAGATVPGYNPCTAPVEAAVDVTPDAFNQASASPWMTATVELPEGYDPAAIDPESVHLMQSIPPDPVFPGNGNVGDENENGIPDAVFKFERSAFVELIPPGATDLEVPLGGMVGGVQFTGSDLVRIVHPQILSPNGGEDLMAGMVNEVAWTWPEEWNVAGTEIQVSLDDGATWEVVTGNAPGNRYLWRLPADAQESVRLRVQVMDEFGLLGIDESDRSFAITTVTVGVEDRLPTRPALLQNLPNPFARSTSISFAVAEGTHATLNIYDIRGHRIRTLVDAWIPSGFHEADWDGRDSSGNRVASGVYLYRLNAGRYQDSRRMLLIRRGG